MCSVLCTSWSIHHVIPLILHHLHSTFCSQLHTSVYNVCFSTVHSPSSPLYFLHSIARSHTSFYLLCSSSIILAWFIILLTHPLFRFSIHNSIYSILHRSFSTQCSLLHSPFSSLLQISILHSAYSNRTSQSIHHILQYTHVLLHISWYISSICIICYTHSPFLSVLQIPHFTIHTSLFTLSSPYPIFYSLRSPLCSLSTFCIEHSIPYCVLHPTHLFSVAHAPFTILSPLCSPPSRLHS